MSISTSNNAANLIQRIGKRDFKYIVMSHVDGLQEDIVLRKFFGKDIFDTNDLATHQEEFLTVAFTSKTTCVAQQYVEGHVELRYYNLINQGFDERHYDRLVTQFVSALADAWIDDTNLIDDAVQTLHSFRHLFAVNNKKDTNARIMVEMKEKNETLRRATLPDNSTRKPKSVTTTAA